MNGLINAKVESGRIAIRWLGQGGFAFKAHAGEIIIVDPYLSDSANRDGNAGRLVDIPIKPQDLKFDHLFLTHEHIDHTDPHTAPIVARHNPKSMITATPSAAALLARWDVPSAQVRAVSAGETLEHDHFTVHVVPARHSEDSVGFVFEFHDPSATAGNPVVYITGDTEYTEQLAPAVADFSPDVLIVPINGRWGNMGAAEAARLTREIGPLEVIPMHYGMFAQNTADPAEFVSLLATELGDKASTRAVVMKHDTTHIYCPPDLDGGKHELKKSRGERARQGRVGREHHDGNRGARPAGSRP